MTTARRAILTIGLLLLTWGCTQSSVPLPATVGGSAGEGDWPTFHGPRRDNVSHETGLLTEWPDAGPELLWAAEGLGEGFATVSIADGAIYTSGNIDNQTMVTSLHLDGTLRWQAPVGQAWTGSYEGSRSTPTIDGDRVYCSSPHGELVCLQAENGETIWQVNILDRFGGRNIIWGLAESPLIDGDHVICTPGGNQGRVAALDKMTGETVWATGSGTGPAGYASAVQAEIHGTRVILTMSGKALSVWMPRPEGSSSNFRYRPTTTSMRPRQSASTTMCTSAPVTGRARSCYGSNETANVSAPSRNGVPANLTTTTVASCIGTDTCTEHPTRETKANGSALIGKPVSSVTRRKVSAKARCYASTECSTRSAKRNGSALSERLPTATI